MPEASNNDSSAPNTVFDIDIGFIHTNILTRVKDKCFVQHMYTSHCDFRCSGRRGGDENFLEKVAEACMRTL